MRSPDVTATTESGSSRGAALTPAQTARFPAAVAPGLRAGRRPGRRRLPRAGDSRWTDRGPVAETLQHLKQLWHVLVRYGESHANLTHSVGPVIHSR
ncbi:DUF3626 domain-containing protein [Micromonospora sp. WMMC250]|uniref:DUF3626 domain-containing protein n=1 Tax=Micromonospora sp. WMMC250 TaxID=3014781 RepID=UPI002FC36944